MNDLISREEAIKVTKSIDTSIIPFAKAREYSDLVIQEVINRITAMPPKRKKGKWISDGHHIRCDQCGMHMCDTDREGDRIPTEFCPNCGAKME